jgi:hypothetical protein
MMVNTETDEINTVHQVQQALMLSAAAAVQHTREEGSCLHCLGTGPMFIHHYLPHSTEPQTPTGQSTARCRCH